MWHLPELLLKHHTFQVQSRYILFQQRHFIPDKRLEFIDMSSILNTPELELTRILVFLHNEVARGVELVVDIGQGGDSRIDLAGAGGGHAVVDGTGGAEVGVGGDSGGFGGIGGSDLAEETVGAWLSLLIFLILSHFETLYYNLN